MRKHICIYPEILESGIGRYSNNLAQALLDLGHKVDIYVTSQKGDMFSQRPPQASLILGKGSTKSSIGAFSNYLKKTRPDLLITAHAYVDIASIIARKFARVPTKHVVTIHTATSRDDQSGKNVQKKVYTQLCRLLYPYADHIVAVSQAVAEDTKHYFNLKDVKVIYNPVVNPLLETKRISPIEHPYFRNPSEPIFISIGRLTEQKDFPTLLRSFALLRKHIPAKLIILGEGEERQTLESLIKHLDIMEDVSLPGFVDNPYPYLSAANVFVSSSAWEGLPTVMIEALALGTQVVATDCPGGSKEILDNGRYGTLVEMSSPEALAKAMQESLKTRRPKEQLKERGRLFSAEIAARNYLKLLDAVSR